MSRTLRIGVIGAGCAGLSAAKVLREIGFDVVAFDAAPDIGGVWSRTRRYPGLTTQNGKDSYTFSDHPMPAHYPEWPTGEQVQQYLESYADRFALWDVLRLNTEVRHAELDEQVPQWRLQLRDTATGAGLGEEIVDHLVVANGLCSTPFVPDFPGADEFEAGGGRLCNVSDVNDLDQVAGKRVLIVGYGRSACDAAAAFSDVAASTDVVARQLMWKVPRRLAGLVNYKYLLLTRFGEGLFRYIRPAGFEKFIHGPGKPARALVLNGLRALIIRQLKLRKIGLVPEGPLERIARSSASLASDGLYDKVVDGRITVRRGVQITRLFLHDGRPTAELSDGATLPADVVVCGTGWQQGVPFLSLELQDRITDEAGNFALYGHVLPHDVPALTFSGYNSSFFSPFNAEIAAWWIGAHLTGQLNLPPEPARRAEVAERLAWMEKRTEGHHSRGANVIPFSIHNMDELLADLGVGISRLERFAEWLRPFNPATYAKVGQQVIARARERLQTDTPTSLAEWRLGKTG